MIRRINYGKTSIPVRAFTKPLNDSKYKMLIESIEGTFLRVPLTPEEASELPPTEHVPLEGHTDEYVIGLDVFHQLHCLVGSTCICV